MSGIAAVRARGRRRTLRITGVVAGVALVVAVVALMVGDYALTPAGVARALTGAGTPIEQYVVTQVRLPRLTMALVCGAMLGLAGALLQTLLRNPLASPDLLGISGGASVAAVFATLVLGLPAWGVTGFAFLGGLVVAAILLGAARRLADGGYRIVLAGVGISFLCAAVIGYLIKRAQVNDAQSAFIWITGSFGATLWRDVLILAVVLALCVPAAVAAGRVLPVVELGDPSAMGLGVRPALVRTGVVAIAVLLAAATTAFIGPVAFIALGAPAMARSLVGRGSPALGTSAVLGAAILVAADLIAQHALPGMSVPVGVVTGAIGAPYLLWLLATSKGTRV